MIDSEACNSGYYGPACELKCRFPSYGYLCQSECLCVENLCDHVTGCNSSNILLLP